MSDDRGIQHMIAGFANQIDSLRAERDALQAKVDAIDALHYPYNGQRGTVWCEAGDCDDSGWPCPTAQILHPEGDTPT